MALIYLLFLVSLVIVVLDLKSPPCEKKLTSWNKGRLKMILASWTMMLGSSTLIIFHFVHWVKH
jgi:hypothetical protein